MKQSDAPVDWELATGSALLNYYYPPLPSVKFQLLCVRMLDVLVVHGMWCAPTPSLRGIEVVIRSVVSIFYGASHDSCFRIKAGQIFTRFSGHLPL